MNISDYPYPSYNINNI